MSQLRRQEKRDQVQTKTICEEQKRAKLGVCYERESDNYGHSNKRGGQPITVTMAHAISSGLTTNAATEACCPMGKKPNLEIGFPVSTLS